MRSATQATVWTLMGCRANNPATMKLRPSKTRRPIQHPEQEQDIQHVQEQIYVVVTGGIQLKKLAIQGVREPGQRMPVGLIVSGERPLDRVPLQAGLHVHVFRDVDGVVVVDERMLVYRIVEREGRDRQQKAQDPGPRLDPIDPSRVGPGLSSRRRYQINRSQSLLPNCEDYIRPKSSTRGRAGASGGVACFPPRRNIPARVQYLRDPDKHGPCYSTQRTLSWRHGKNSGLSYIARWPRAGFRVVARR